MAGEASNPSLLLFHGAGDNSALMWLNNAVELSRHYRMQARFNHIRRTFSCEEIDTIRDNALFLTGDADGRVNFPEDVRANKDFRINARVIEGAGHAVNQIKPREIETGKNRGRLVYLCRIRLCQENQ